jgi:hypothetical protein
LQVFWEQPLAPPSTKFEVATVKPTGPDWRGGRYIRLTSPQRFVAMNFTLGVLMGAAYNLSPGAILRGPDCTDSDRYDIVAATPGEIRPTSMSKCRCFGNCWRTGSNSASIAKRRNSRSYVMSVARNGPTLKESTATPDAPPELVN